MPPDPVNRTSNSCNACKKLEVTIDPTGLQYQPGLVALNASAASCDFCYILLMSLDGRRSLETWIDEVKEYSPEDSLHGSNVILVITVTGEKSKTFRRLGDWVF